MAFRKEIDFFFLGARNYVNGLTIFEEMIKAGRDLITQAYGPIKTIPLFKINKFIRSNCSLDILGPGEQPESGPQEAAAVMTLGLVNGSEVRLHLLEKEEPVPARLPDYDRARYIGPEISNEAGPVSVTIRNIKNEYDLIRAVVEASYRHCVALAAAEGVHRGVSWAYLKHYPWLEKLKASQVEVLNFRKLSVFPTRERIFFIRMFSLDAAPDVEIEIGFFFDIPNRP